MCQHFVTVLYTQESLLHRELCGFSVSFQATFFKVPSRVFIWQIKHDKVP